MAGSGNDGSSKHRRRSSANVVEGALSPGSTAGLWSHTHPQSSKPNTRERRKSSFSRRLSIGASAPSTTQSNVSAAQRAPPSRDGRSPTRSPTLSPRKRGSQSSSPNSRLRSPPPFLDPNTVPTLPRLTYDPVSASTSGIATPGIIPLVLPASGVDYFGSKLVSAHSPKRSPRPDVTAGAYSPSRATGAIETRKPSVGSKEPDAQHGTVSDADNSDSAHQRDSREQDKKTMLSRALQKAHTAVLLDNAQNYEGAIEAYGEACSLLHQVLMRSSGEEDRKKLDAIVSFGVKCCQ